MGGWLCAFSTHPAVNSNYINANIMLILIIWNELVPEWCSIYLQQLNIFVKRVYELFKAGRRNGDCVDEKRIWISVNAKTTLDTYYFINCYRSFVLLQCCCKLTCSCILADWFLGKAIKPNCYRQQINMEEKNRICATLLLGWSSWP